MVVAVFLLIIALGLAEAVERVVAMVASDGLSSRNDSQLPRSHRGEALNPLR